MYAGRTYSRLPFWERVARLLEKTSYLCKPSPETGELVKLARRARAPLGGGDEPYFDPPPVDADPHALNDFDILTLLDGHVAGTLRVRFDRAERKTIEISELTIERTFALELPGLPYLALRAAWLAAEHYSCEIVLMDCPGDQRAFYARVFGFEAPGASSEQAGGPISRMALDFQQAKDRVEDRYPIFRSTAAERLSIFGGSQSKPKHQPSAQSADC